MFVSPWPFDHRLFHDLGAFPFLLSILCFLVISLSIFTRYSPDTLEKGVEKDNTMTKILLATNSEFGQANVFLAVGHALQALDSKVQVHFVSFAAISQPVSAASEYSVRCSPGAQPWTFHELDGPSYFDAMVMDSARVSDILVKRPGFFTTVELQGLLSRFLLPWNGAGFIQVYQSFVRLVEDIRPDLVVVDCLFSPALSACHHIKSKHIILSPNTLKDFCAASQPWGAGLWKYPV